MPLIGYVGTASGDEGTDGCISEAEEHKSIKLTRQISLYKPHVTSQFQFNPGGFVTAVRTAKGLEVLV